jgi:hypothetical protein
VDDDAAGGGPSGPIAVTGNTITNIGVVDAIVIIAQDPGVDVCAHITGNNFAGAGTNKNILREQSLSAVLQIPQASVAALAAANTGATASSSGTITFNSSCSSPPLPDNP